MSDKRWITVLVLLPVTFLAACSFGRVSQGRVVAYDQASGTATVIQEANEAQSGQARYVLPPVTVKIPANPQEMGPAPATGNLLSFNSQARQLIVFEPASRSFRTISYTPVSEQTSVFADDPRVAKVKFPIIHRQDKTITLYSAHERMLVTFTVADEFLALPDETWKAGDEVRYYYKEPGQALRFMNVTKTDVRKGG